MTIQLHIPESVATSLQIPGPGLESQLESELAVTLYSQGILSFGKAAELAEISRFSFADLLGSRGVARHYGEDELAQDLDYAVGTPI